MHPYFGRKWKAVVGRGARRYEGPTRETPEAAYPDAVAIRAAVFTHHNEARCVVDPNDLCDFVLDTERGPLPVTVRIRKRVVTSDHAS